MNISIYTGKERSARDADVCVVIDVIRAFTVADVAFEQGVERILLVAEPEEAFSLKDDFPDVLLAGEVGGHAIEGFDFDNSPLSLLNKNLTGKTLVQRTTNGVQAVLNNLHAEQVFVTGLRRARTTAEYIARSYRDSYPRINIVASHPQSDEDVACAEYVEGVLENVPAASHAQAVERLYESQVAQKFLDPENPDFNAKDLVLCSEEKLGGFVMCVKNKNSQLPYIEAINL